MHACRSTLEDPTAAAEAADIVLFAAGEEGSDAPARPARVFLALERVGAPAVGASASLAIASEAPLRRREEIARRAARERTREGFFLDPKRPLSPVIGALEPDADAARRAAIVAAETGATAARPLAVTSLERFAQCAFKGYAHVVLSAREGEEQRELPDAREEGNLGHTALAAAFVATREEWPRRPRDAARILEVGLAAADAALAASAGHAPLRAIARLRVRESVRAVLGRAIEDEEWDFALAEQAFGNGKPWPAFEVDPELWLRGSIDRVDRAHHRALARVVDYKRSKSTVGASTAHLGESALQIPLYAAVASRRLEMPSTGAYVPMLARDVAEVRGKSRGAVKGEDRVAELAERGPGGSSPIERRALDLVRSARAGDFAPIPAREAECTHCSASGGCRKPRFAMAAEEDEET